MSHEKPPSKKEEPVKNFVSPEERIEQDRRAMGIIAAEDIGIATKRLSSLQRIGVSLRATAGAPGMSSAEHSDDAMASTLGGFADDVDKAANDLQKEMDTLSDAPKSAHKMSEKERTAFIMRQTRSQNMVNSASKTPCYLTTACTVAHALPDDCDELVTLRQFRDEYMLKLPNGRAMIEEYYRIAPLIIEEIQNSSDPHQIYNSIFDVIRCCVKLIKSGENQEALDEYKSMVLGLKQRFGVD